MTGRLIRYSAVTAKARAMYGKKLSPNDWSELMAAGDLRQLRELLGRSPAWADAVQDTACAADPALFCRQLEEQVAQDIRKLFLYLKKSDCEILVHFLDRPTDGSMTPEEAKRWWREGGAEHAGLRRIAGAEADGLNLVYILRLRRFPGTAQNIELLIPVRDKLTPELCRRLLAAEDDREVFYILEGTPWRGVFSDLASGALEREYGVYMAAFCRRVLSSAQPSLTAVQAFITLREMECEKLRRLIGAISRGIDPQTVV